MVIMLMMRRHEKDFLLRLDGKYIGRMDERLAEFNIALEQSDIPQQAKPEIMKLMRTYHAAVEEQMAATQEIARNAEQASAGTNKVTENIEGVSTLAHETEESARQVHEASDDVKKQSDQLNEFIHRFLSNVRTA